MTQNLRIVLNIVDTYGRSLYALDRAVLRVEDVDVGGGLTEVKINGKGMDVAGLVKKVRS